MSSATGGRVEMKAETFGTQLRPSYREKSLITDTSRGGGGGGEKSHKGVQLTVKKF